jgi:hypothetical protein
MHFPLPFYLFVIIVLLHTCICALIPKRGLAEEGLLLGPIDEAVHPHELRQELEGWREEARQRPGERQRRKAKSSDSFSQRFREIFNRWRGKGLRGKLSERFNKLLSGGFSGSLSGRCKENCANDCAGDLGEYLKRDSARDLAMDSTEEWTRDSVVDLAKGLATMGAKHFGGKAPNI